MLLFLIVTAALVVSSVAYAALRPDPAFGPEVTTPETLVADERGVTSG